MSKTIPVVFDGTSFVPTEPVALPVGTRTSVVVADPPRPSAAPPEPVGRPPRPLTADEEREWEEILTAIRATPPDPPTVEEAMRLIRGRP